MIKTEIELNGTTSTMRVQFYLKKVSKTNSQIWLLTSIGGKATRVFTRLLIQPQYWVKKTRYQIGECALEDNSRMTANDLEHSREVNKRLGEILEYCHEYGKAINRPSILGEKTLEHTSENFKTFIYNKLGVNKPKKNPTLQFIEDLIEERKMSVNERTHKRIAPTTITSHMNTLKTLQRYCADNKVNLSFELFNKHFYVAFTDWLNNQNYCANTISRHFGILKCWLRVAYENGLVKDLAFTHYTTKKTNTDNIALTEDEIARIYAIDFESDEIKKAIHSKRKRIALERNRDNFIIACWTGLRYSDWTKLKGLDLSGETVSVRTQKTDATVALPIHPMVKAISKKYHGNIPTPPTRQSSWMHIKEIGKLAGINEPCIKHVIKGGKVVTITKPRYEFIGNHTARRSFATNAYKRKIPTITIMAITGHTSEANFLRYIKISNEEHAKAITKVWNK